MSTASPDPHDSRNERDFALLQGVWVQVQFEENGVVDPPDVHGGAGALTTIAGDRFSVRTLGGELLLEGRFELDASTTPASITWIDAIGADAGKRLPASYQLNHEQFVFIAADEGMPRPLAFRTAPGLTLRGFVRQQLMPRDLITAAR